MNIRYTASLSAFCFSMAHMFACAPDPGDQGEGKFDELASFRERFTDLDGKQWGGSSESIDR